jgi:hypothetical protein
MPVLKLIRDARRLVEFIEANNLCGNDAPSKRSARFQHLVKALKKSVVTPASSARRQRRRS